MRATGLLTVVLSLSLGSTALAGIESVRGLYDAKWVNFDVRFTDATSLDGGWTFQLFIDSDGNEETGYGPGFDLLVRGVEAELADPMVPPYFYVHLRTTGGGVGPGGWGPSVGMAPVWIWDDGRLKFSISLDESGLKKGRFRFSFESYYGGRLEDAVLEQWTTASSPDPLACVTSTYGWQNLAITPQSGLFTVHFDATPNDLSIEGLFSLSSGETAALSDSAVTSRFNVDGYVDAFDWGDPPESPSEFTADVVIYYWVGTAYHFRVETDIPRHLYSVYVTPEGLAEQQIALDYAFRKQEPPVTTLDHWAVRAEIGSNSVCDFLLCSSASTGLNPYVALADCMGGPQHTPEPTLPGACLDEYDLDGDADVDLRDFSLWLTCFNDYGP